jgi:quinol monooxygenase YgiN
VSNGHSVAAAGGHVVIAELEVKSERMEDFIVLARAFAATCRIREPGCRQFQVVRLDSTPNHLLFFEVYDDIAAFDVHRASDHLVRFKATFQGVVTSEQPLRLGSLEPEAI